MLTVMSAIIMREQVIDAALVLRDFCESQASCRECPFAYLTEDRETICTLEVAPCNYPDFLWEG